MVGKLTDGKMEWTFANGVIHLAEGWYNTETKSYWIRGAHGPICPWDLGSSLARINGPCIEMSFHEHDGETAELWYDRHGVWIYSTVPDLLRKMAPVHWSELRASSV